MNIHKTTPFISAKKEEEILHLGNWYYRKEFSDNTFVWAKMHDGGYNIQTPDELEKEYQKLINKPVETTNEQLNDNFDLKNKIMNLISEHMKLRNEDGVKDINLYHKFLDWEKELVKLMV